MDPLYTRADPLSLYHSLIEIHHGVIYIAREQQFDTSVLIKKRALTDQVEEGIHRDIAVLKSLQHPNIVAYFDSLFYDNAVWLIFEYMDGGSLHELILANSMTEGEIAAVSREVAKGLEYLHQKGIIHRNLCSDNILLNFQGDVKLSDFSSSTDVSAPALLSLADATVWVPPEVFTKETYSTKFDIWSLGVLAFEMIEGNPPYHEYDPSIVVGLIATEGLPGLSHPETLSQHCKDYILQTLQMNPDTRPEVTQILKHPFFEHADPLDKLVSLMR